MSHSPNSRKLSDFSKLVVHGYTVELIDDNPQHFWVSIGGPADTPYADLSFRVRCELPENYPFTSPSVGFEPFTMYHPNVDYRSGSVCLDVINQTWTPLYSLVNVFDTFLPQLLTYPNEADPLNAEAASLSLTNKKEFAKKVRAHLPKEEVEKPKKKEKKSKSNLQLGPTRELPRQAPNRGRDELESPSNERSREGPNRMYGGRDRPSSSTASENLMEKRDGKDGKKKTEAKNTQRAITWRRQGSACSSDDPGPFFDMADEKEEETSMTLVDTSTGTGGGGSSVASPQSGPASRDDASPNVAWGNVAKSGPRNVSQSDQQPVSTSDDEAIQSNVEMFELVDYNRCSSEMATAVLDDEFA